MTRSRRFSSVVIGAALALALTAPLHAGLGGWTFIRGDYNGDGNIDLADGVGILEYLFVAGTPDPLCFDAADVNDDGTISLVDAVYELNYALAGGPPPPSPFPDCGVDLTFDGLGCNGPLAFCDEADLPPNLLFDYSNDATENTVGVRMHPNSAPITGGNFDELRFRMRPATLQFGGSTGTVSVSLTGGDIDMYTTAGVQLPNPAVFNAADLPTTILFNANAPGTTDVTAVASSGGIPDLLTIHTSLDPGLAGGDLGSFPWFEHVRTINSNDEVLTAIDPNTHGDRLGLSYRVYVVESKTPAQWAADNTLVDVSGGFEVDTVNGTSIQTNIVDAWLSGLITSNDVVGTGYDIVYDFGNDGTLDPGDLIDGLQYGEAGFYIMKNLNIAGPYSVTAVNYSGGTWLGQRTYYPSNISSLGQLPLVVISHGNGHQYTWYDYLGNHLASHGFIVMSHQNQTGPGIETASTTTLTNTDYLLGNLGSIAGGALQGHVDSSRIAWVGHSRGGEGVARAYDRIFDGVWNPIQYDLPDIRLVSSIAPTVFLGVASANPHGVNYHLIAGAGDGDVNGGPSCSLCQFFRIHQAGTGNTLATYLQGVGHNEFNCCGFADTQGPSQIGRPAAQVVAKSYYLAIMEYFLKDNIAGKDYLVRNFDGFKPWGIATNVVVANQWKDPSNTTYVIDNFQSQTSTGTASSGASISSTVNNLVEGILNDNNTSFTWTTSDPMNGMTQASDGLDQSRGNIFDFNTGQQVFIDYAIPAAAQDFSGDQFLTLRACQGTRHPNTVSTLDFTVTLVDGSGTTSSINFGQYGTLTRPYLRTGEGSGAGWANEYNIVRLRLVDFTNDGSGLDLSDITNVRLEFGSNFGSARGRVGIDDLQLSND